MIQWSTWPVCSMSIESDDDVEEEKLQEMIDWYGTVDEWVAQVKEEISK